MTALVTGVAGFIGSHLAEALIERGQDVIGIDCFLDYYPRSIKQRNLASLQEKNGFRLIECPIQELDLDPLMAETDVVFHLAAQAGVRASWGTEFSIYTENNILATQQLLEAGGLVQRSTRPGDRRERFSIPSDFARTILERRMSLVRQWVVLADLGLEALADRPPAASDRLRDLRSTWEFMEGEIPALLERYAKRQVG